MHQISQRVLGESSKTSRTSSAPKTSTAPSRPDRAPFQISSVLSLLRTNMVILYPRSVLIFSVDLRGSACTRDAGAARLTENEDRVGLFEASEIPKRAEPSAEQDSTATSHRSPEVRLLAEFVAVEGRISSLLASSRLRPSTVLCHARARQRAPGESRETYKIFPLAYLSLPPATITTAPSSNPSISRFLRCSYSSAEMPRVSSPGASRCG